MNILHEDRDNRSKEGPSLDEFPFIANSVEGQRSVDEPAEAGLDEERNDCLDHCLKKLPEQNRILIVGYYQGDAGVKIDNRSALARQLGIPLNTLRIRVLRIRRRLKDCIMSCLEPPLAV